MHIEPGFIAQAKILAANGTLTGVLIWHGKELIRQPAQIVRTLLAAIFFLLFMQTFHISVGPSELYFAGAMPIYLTLGFIPALVGIVLALLLQCVLFEPLNLPQLAVNSLPLLLPLIAVRFTLGRKLANTTNGHHPCWRSILKLGAMYYAGMTGMVGFWLLIAPVNTPFATWGAFAASCLAIATLESAVTYFVLRIRRLQKHAGRAYCASSLRWTRLRSPSL